MTTSTHSELELDAIRICQELIRIPSVNFGDGKGDEKDVADYVVKQLAEVGIESKIYESVPGRCNVIARIKGSNSNRPGLVVHGHLDVVPANAADWSVDPFSAELKDGYIWGRGAVDMKNMDAMILATVRSWAELVMFQSATSFLHSLPMKRQEVFMDLTTWLRTIPKFSPGAQKLFLKLEGFQ